LTVATLLINARTGSRVIDGMGQVHQLITGFGVEEAKARAADKLDRQCVETAFAVMTDAEARVGIMHAGFAMTALPHKAIVETQWLREGAGIKLLIEGGTDGHTLQPVGIPFGSIARLILLYLQTRAVRTKSREIELGGSMNEWLAKMGVEVGGKTSCASNRSGSAFAVSRSTVKSRMQPSSPTAALCAT
jgi:hypothetical protein